MAGNEPSRGEELASLLEALSPLLAQYLNENDEPDRRICESMPPDELRSRLDLDLPAEGKGRDALMVLIKQMLRYSVRTGHPRFMDKLYVGAEPIGMVSELLTAVLNTNMHVYQVAPVFTLIEIETIRRVGQLFGYADADGVTCPGGSSSNILALVAARHRKFPYIKEHGMRGTERMVALTSTTSHYSLSKAANLMGLGTASVIGVPCDAAGRMLPDALATTLEKCRAAGQTPFIICATSGTTVFGAYDHLAALSAVARANDCWLHTDACWGGSVVFSDAHRHLMDGSGLTDSIAWNAHKMLGVPIQTSLLLVRERGSLHGAMSCGAEYLFHGDSPYDLGDKTFQCGRRPDIVKLFLSWQHEGAAGFGRRVDAAFSAVARFVAMLKERAPEFEMVQEPHMLNVCFRYVPERIRKAAEGGKDVISEYVKKVHAVLIKRARVYTDYAPDPNGGPHFFRIVISSPRISDADLAIVFDEIIEAERILLAEAAETTT